MNPLHTLIAIIGPTAVGKSALAMRLARLFQGETVNADSRQVYRYMDIGTDKPSATDRASVPHHLIDIASPNEDFSLALYLGLAKKAIDDIRSRGRLPIVVGGTGQYVWGLLEGWSVPPVAPDTELRQRLARQAQEEGPMALYRELMALDPLSAQRIDPRNVRRVIRALELYYSTGTPASQLQTKSPPPYETLILGLTLERQELYRRIDSRIDAMIQAGWQDEVRGLLSQGYRPDLPAMSGLGYREILLHLQGSLTLEGAVQRIKYNTHRFARHQYAWFRLADPRIRRLEATPETLATVPDLVRAYLATPGHECAKIKASQ